MQGGTSTPQAAALPLPPDSDLGRRFGGLERLYGVPGAARIRAAHVLVSGIGGVGSWAVEALARSGVGALTLIDLDHVAESNINRQIHALDDTIGQAKVDAMRERIAHIHPACRVLALDESGDATTSQILGWSRGRGADTVLVCAAGHSDEPMSRAPTLCRDRAAIVVVGDVGMPPRRAPYYKREISVLFARSYGPGRYEPSYEERGVDYAMRQLRDAGAPGRCLGETPAQWLARLRQEGFFRSVRHPGNFAFTWRF